MKFNLTKEEKKVIADLKRVAKIWPDSLWLFSASGSLCVMRNDKNGNRVIDPRYGGVEQSHIVDHIDIENDGGDW